MNIKLGDVKNLFCVHVYVRDNEMYHQEIRINANFENIPLFVKTLGHEYLHAVINSEVDKSGVQSHKLDNIDGYFNKYAISSFFNLDKCKGELYER